ncbi:MAG: hypothetical protein ACLQVL_34665 [Terriglobia bacterium]
MPRVNKRSRSLRCRSQREHPHQQPHPTRRATWLASSGQLMAQGSGLVLPRLSAVPVVHRLVADDRLAVLLAKALLDLDIAVPGDWKKAEHDPTSFIRITLERWIRTHGGPAIRHRFLLSAVISNSPSDWAERDEIKPNQLFLIVEPSEATCACAAFGPTLKLLENVHPQLPATFFHLFVGALNRWLRVYDLRDAEERAETLREWAAQEPDADQYEVPDVNGSIPPCMRQAGLENSELAHVKDRINDSTARKLVDAVIALDGVSRGVERPEVDDAIGEQLSDCNPPLPCLLAVFVNGDAIAGCFDEEAQGMMEVEPEPNIIIPFDPTDTASVHRTFHTFGVACQTIAAASGIIDLMPGNDQWIISR